MKLKDEIAYKLMFSLYERGEILLPNFFWTFFEADILRIRRSGQVYEYEIKTTRADYFKDFEKGFGGYSTPTTKKHELIQTKQANISRFLFVVPEGLIKHEEVPDYAGLIYYTPGGGSWFHNQLSGKSLTRHPIIDYKMIAGKIGLREYEFRRKFRFYNETLNELRDENRWLRSRIKSELNK